jgi:hypothetical protein
MAGALRKWYLLKGKGWKAVLDKDGRKKGTR